MEKQNKDIIIIADFCGFFDGNDNSRFIYLAKMMLDAGHKVEIITSDFSHGKKSNYTNVITSYQGLKITMLHEDGYAKNVSIKRFISHYRWGKSVKKYLDNRNKPDVVYCAVPTLKASKEAARYCRKNGIRFIIDIQDLWPEAFKMVFNVPIISSLLYFPFKTLANYAYKRADIIVGVSETYVNRAMTVNKKAKKGYPVFLGTDLSQFDENANGTDLLEKAEKEMWIGYCGTLGASYDLTVVFKAMRILNKPNLKFVIMGSGPKESLFSEQARGLNVCFTGRLPYKTMCGILRQCDMVVNPIMHNAAQSIINKHADYAAAGKAVLNTQESNEYRNLIDKYNMGFNVSNNNPKELADKIDLLMRDSKKRIEMGLNSRKCAEDLFDRKKTYREILFLL